MTTTTIDADELKSALNTLQWRADTGQQWAATILAYIAELKQAPPAPAPAPAAPKQTARPVAKQAPKVVHKTLSIPEDHVYYLRDCDQRAYVILCAVAQCWHRSPESIISSRRSATVYEARCCFAFMLRRLGYSYPEIATATNRRAHDSAICAVRNFGNTLERSAIMREFVKPVESVVSRLALG